MAQAVKRLYPDTKCAIGSAIENGFYYDFEFSFPFSEENLKEVEKEMRRIVKESLSLQVFEKTKTEAIEYMKKIHEDYKLELICELEDNEKISYYKQGDYEEFCAGPHISNVCQIKAIKLLSVAGAYWRGKESNPMLTSQLVIFVVIVQRLRVESCILTLDAVHHLDEALQGRTVDGETHIDVHQAVAIQSQGEVHLPLKVLIAIRNVIALVLQVLQRIGNHDGLSLACNA